MGKYRPFLSKQPKRGKKARSRKAFLERKYKETFISGIIETIVDNTDNEKMPTAFVDDMMPSTSTLSDQIVDTASPLQPMPESENEDSLFLEKYELIDNHQLCIESAPLEDLKRPDGYRIVDINYLFNKLMPLQSNHNKRCTGGRLEYFSETRHGLVSTFTFKCNVCDKEFSTNNEDPNKKETLNYSAVWGTLSIGSSHTHLNELLSVLDIPCLSGTMFHKIQRELSGVWRESLWKIMEEAGTVEYNNAKSKGDVDEDGIPYITVYLDGGWAKRSYGHNYNSASGVAVIIGKYSGKLLFVGVRNKYCSICARAENKGHSPPNHICFKNWNGSSSAMEQDIVVEGFNNSIEMHGVRYKKFIADGDSSVYSKIRENVEYGSQVMKIECTNHAVKNYSKHLYGIKKDTKNVSLAARKFLTSDNIEALVKATQKAMYCNAQGDIDQLKTDIRNSINHVFGNHFSCRDYLCSTPGDIRNDRTPELTQTGVHHHIYGALSQLLAKAHLLIDNETNNRSELFMSLLARFNMGKRLNLVQRDGFQTRAYLTGLKYNEGHSWHTKPWKTLFKRSPGKNFKNYMKRQEDRLRKRKDQPENRPAVAKKLKFASTSSTGTDYGSNIAEVEINDDNLKNEVEELIKRLKVSVDDIKEIAKNTVGQFTNKLYQSQRMGRLTASNFGAVIRRQDSTSCDSLVKRVLVTQNFSTPATEYGKRHEKTAISKFMALYDKIVQPSGIFIHPEHGYLAASPDGIINDDEIIEVKCIFKVASLGRSLDDAVRNKEVSCLQIIANEIQLKKTHDYFYQVQGQLEITGASKCHFIVYSGDSNPLLVKTVDRDVMFWKNVMFPKLERFYINCVAPEIILNRRAKNLQCRDPKYILEAQKIKEDKKQKL